MGRRIIAFLLALLILTPIGIIPGIDVSAAEVNTNGHRTYNTGLSAVPAPGEVVVDGNFDEWDWSGRAKHYPDYDLIDNFYCESAYMWDKENLYLGYKFTDETPAMSLIDPVLEPKWTWRGDAIQLRFVTDRPAAWVTIGYYDKTETASLHITYPDETDEISYTTNPGETKLINVTSEVGVPKLKCFDAEIKYKVWDEGGGYNVEMKIPWKMLFLSADSIAAGKQMTMHVECYWGKLIPDAVYHETSVLDNFVPGKSGGGNRQPETWGLLTLEANGNLPLREYIHENETTIAGTIHIPVKVPKEAKKITLVLEDKNGKRIANMVSELDIAANVIGEEGDYDIVDTLWNGTGLMGDMVSPGEYVVKGIYHNGITPKFDYTAYNPGNPPWPDSTGVGSWGSDHMAASAIASSGNVVYLGHRNAESGTGLFALTPDGKKKWGIMRGAEFMSANDSYVYTLPGNDFYANTANAGNAYLMRVDAENGKMIPFTDKDGNDKDLLLFLDEILGINGGVMPSVGGIAANNEHLVLTTKSNNIDVATPGIIDYGARVNVLNVETAELVRSIAVPDVGYAAFGKNGLLYAVTGNTISEINVETGKVKVLPIKAPKNGEFSVIAVDNDGNIVVFDKGEDRQFKIYSTGGRLLYTIGKKGGRALIGKWDPDGFTKMVSGVTITADGLIWVSERWNFPRRLSCWNKDGFVKDYIGNPGYQGAGTWLDDVEEDIVYVGPNKLSVDKENMTYQMESVLWVPDRSKGEAFPIEVTANARIQKFSKEINGVKNDYIYRPSNAYDKSNVLYRFVDEYSVKPFWATGRIENLWQEFGYGYYTETEEAMVYYSNPDKKTPAECFPGIANLPASTQYIWNDYNYDGAVQYSECEFMFPADVSNSSDSAKNAQPQITNSGWGNIISDNMTFILTDRNGFEDNERPGNGFIFEPEYYTDDGLPRYTKKSIKKLNANRRIMDWENTITPDGTRFLSIATRHIRKNTYMNGIKAVDLETGEDLWWFDNSYPGVHGGKRAPVSVQGQVLGPIKQLGTVEVDGVEIFAMRGYYGQDFFMTTDGFYIQSMFKDNRIPRKRLPDNKFDAKDMDLSQMTEGSEPYSGTMVKHPDGVVRLVTSIAGPSVLVARIEGLDTIEYIKPFKLVLTKKMLEEAEAFNSLDPEELSSEEEDKTTEEKTKELTIYKAPGDMTIDANASDWGSIPDIKVSQDQVAESAKVKLAYDDKNLYVLYNVTDKSPMANSANDIYHIFKSGDVCDINLSPTGNTSSKPSDGDLRLYMSYDGDEPIAMLLKQVSNGTKKPFAYTSPVMGLEFDYVQQCKDVEMKLVRSDSSYILETRIPLDILGLKAEPGKSITGDIGIISSDEFGVDNIARTYYFNKDTGLTEDVPGEVMLTPNQWGRLIFEK